MHAYLPDDDGKASQVFVKFRAHPEVLTPPDALRYLRERRPSPLKLRLIEREKGMTVLLEASYEPRIILGRSAPRIGERDSEIKDIVRVLEINGVPCVVPLQG